MKRIMGLDIGGANIKAATSDACARSVSFRLWKHPEQLAERLRSLAADLPSERVAVTMTGELCDCFATKREGVAHIVAAVEQACAGREIAFWSTAGRFLTAAEACAQPLEVAAANWHALATLAGTWAPGGFALLIDIGSTTTDIIPIRDGVPCPQGRTDPLRLASSELVYTGARRTPVCAILGLSHAAELFATTLDAYLLLGDIGEDPTSCDSADGRPATIACAHARMARMMCDDVEGMSLAQARALARQVSEQQVQRLAAAVRRCVERMGRAPALVIMSGSGEFLVAPVLAAAGLNHVPTLSLSQRLGTGVSSAACAYAVAKRAELAMPQSG